MGIPGPRGATGQEGPPVCFESILCNVNVNICYLVSTLYVISVLIPVKG